MGTDHAAILTRQPDCAPTLHGSSWSHLPPTAFDGSTDKHNALAPNGWSNQACVYNFTASGSGFSFTSPLGCLDNWWTAAALELLAAGRVEMTLQNHTARQTVRGTINEGCDLIDMDDGGLYLRGATPHDMSDRDWLRATVAWLVRAAQITFADGTHHLTPGYPTHYDGQWLRDGYYGISNGWDRANRTHQQSFKQSMYSCPSPPHPTPDPAPHPFHA